jgi:enolase
MPNNSIKQVRAYEILDSRGNPTVAAEVILNSDERSMAFVPSGASTGKYEASEKRDNDNSRYLGKGVLSAVNSINTEINSLLQGKDPSNIKEIDTLLIESDGSPNKSNFGANAILGVSMACSRVAAQTLNLELYDFINLQAREIIGSEINQKLPIPMMNILNGGAHADNPIDFQEFMIQPSGFESFSDSLRSGVEIFHTLKDILKNKNLNTAVGDEGGFAPNLSSPQIALDLIMESIERAGYIPGEQVFLCLDVAATEFYQNSIYNLKGMDERFSSSDMVSYLKDLRSNYPISSIEDGLDEDDWNGWTNLTSEIGSNTQIVGDDLFVTNPLRITEGIEKKAANAVLVKVNQIGTLTETIEAIQTASNHNFKSIVSHRSGETEDSFIADFSVGMGTGQIKTGAPSRSDRVAKYNRLLIVENQTSLCFG